VGDGRAEPIGLSGEAKGWPRPPGAHHEDAGEIGAEGLEAQGNGGPQDRLLH